MATSNSKTFCTYFRRNHCRSRHLVILKLDESVVVSELNSQTEVINDAVFRPIRGQPTPAWSLPQVIMDFLMIELCLVYVELSAPGVSKGTDPDQLNLWTFKPLSLWQIY